MYAYIYAPCMYVSLLRNNTYITAMYIFTYETPTYSTSLPFPSPCSLLPFFAIQFSWLLFLFGQLNRLWLCVCSCPPLSVYTIWHFYKLQIHTRTPAHTRTHAYQSAIIHSLLASASSSSHLRFQFVRFNNSQFNKC